jgi:acetyl/propionyl-CoA carboxylase alpha subunit
VIAYGKDRPAAITKLKRALSETVIDGVATTIPFFEALLEKEEFARGDFYTNYIEKSGIIRELMLTPYLKKKIVCERKDFDEEAVAQIVHKIYQELKGAGGGAQSGGLSQWVMADRTNEIEN